MGSRDYLNEAINAIRALKGNTYGVLDVASPTSVDEAMEVGQVINKITPIVANTLEFRIAEYLNNNMDLPDGALWKRQDPEFPDVVLTGLSNGDVPGVEVKGWYPLATEMTGRFRETERKLKDDLTKIAVIAWVPENIIYGQPKIIDVFIDDALAVAESRDGKYHNPPEYLVLEPFDTTNRTRNLQQSNVRGHKLQEDDHDDAEIKEAHQLIQKLGLDLNGGYDPSFEYHRKLQRLYSQFSYREDTNFAKLSRLKHAPLDQFETDTLNKPYKGKTILEWRRAISNQNERAVKDLLKPDEGQENLKDFSPSDID